MKEEKGRLSNLVTVSQVEKQALTENLKKQEIRIAELEKNKIRDSQLEKIKSIIDEKKALRSKVKVLEAEIRKLHQVLETTQKKEEKKVVVEEKKSLPRNTGMKKKEEEEMGEETVRIVEHLNEFRSKAKEMEKTVMSSVPKGSGKKRNYSDISKEKSNMELTDKKERVVPSSVSKENRKEDEKDESCHIN